MSTPDSTPDSETAAAQLAALGPKPFVFHPRTDTIEGPAFSRAFQTITWATLLGSGYWLLKLWQEGKFGGDTGLEGLRAGGWFVLGWVLLAWTTWHVMFSRARLDDKGIHQTWIWDKYMGYDELAYAKLIRIRGLEWFMAPRFYVRTLMGKFAVFYVSSPHVQQECERLSAELAAFRDF
ncbi:MAG: hypothetical protein RLY41_91 [Pseudomonadota bacterium]|jgi:hypothetical protein